jgi:exodeoxyribonuclease III
MLGFDWVLWRGTGDKAASQARRDRSGPASGPSLILSVPSLLPAEGDDTNVAFVRIATWNVNSIRARHELVLDWLRRREPDVVCLQETKVVDDEFPTDEFQRLGYAVAMAGQPSYNGVAIASRLGMRDIAVGLWDDGPSADKRLIAATIGDHRVLSVYVPNGKSVDSPSFADKLRWLARLKETLERRCDQAVILGGDFNVARDDRDVYDPEAFRGQLHFHPDEHAALSELLSFGLVDAYRLHHDEGGRYSWWDYRGTGVRRNRGLRIDYLFLSQSLAARCESAEMDAEERKRERPSDHVPVVADLG